MSKKTGFTLIEILITVAITGIILSVAYSAFQGIMKSQIRLSNTINMEKNLLYINEKLGQLIHDGGTIDYEEYFNRRMLGYQRDFIGSPGIFTYTEESKFGNYTPGNQIVPLSCNNCSDNGITISIGDSTISGQQDSLSGQQIYGQYRALGSSVIATNPVPLPSIFPISTMSKGLPELYLIKRLPDNSYERTYLRHILVQDPLVTTICSPGTGMNCLGKIQMTKLISCDKFILPNIPGKDNVPDSWIPAEEFDQGGSRTQCPIVITNIGNASENHSWIDLTSPDINVISAQFLPHPFKIPTMMSGAGEIAESPIIDVRLEVKLSQTAVRKSLMNENENFTKTLMTTYELKEL